MHSDNIQLPEAQHIGFLDMKTILLTRAWHCYFCLIESRALQWLSKTAGCFLKEHCHRSFSVISSQVVEK